MPKRTPVNGNGMTPLEKAQAVLNAKRKAGELVVERLNPFEKARRNPKSKKLAIRAFCWQCQGEGNDPGTIDGIRDCPCEKTCPLWPHRPYQTKKDTEDSE